MIKDTENGVTHFVADDATLAYIVKLETELAALKATGTEPVAELAMLKEGFYEKLWKNSAPTEAQFKAAQREVLEKAKQSCIKLAWSHDNTKLLGPEQNCLKCAAEIQRMIDKL